jgi:DNA invertase Pin-like site-specific DNA recombinase
MKKYNVAAYIRLSVDDGDKAESNSVKNQKEMIRGYINNQEDMNLYDFYVDDGYSGTSFDRPGFKSMIQDMYDKKFDTIMVKDLSRLGRNYIDTGRYIGVKIDFGHESVEML